MYRALGFRFNKPAAIILLIALLAVFVFSYHAIIEKSVRSSPESTQIAVQRYCQYMFGKQLNNFPKDEFETKFRKCGVFSIKSVKTSGGVFDPVIVRIEVDAEPGSPLDKNVLIFKTADISPRRFNFINSLSRLMSGRWEFNHYNAYSETTFHGNF